MIYEPGIKPAKAKNEKSYVTFQTNVYKTAQNQSYNSETIKRVNDLLGKLT